MIRLVEVAVAVRVVAIPNVELRQVGVDLRLGLAGGDLRGVPRAGGVAHEQPRARADDATAIIRAVVGLVERHFHPVGHVAVHGVAARRLLDVEIAHRDRARRWREQHVFVVRLGKIGRPDRRVVHGAVRLWDLVAQRTRGAAVRRIDLRAELREDREDLVLALAREFDELALRHFDDLIRSLALLLALKDLVQSLLTKLELLAPERMLDVVAVASALGRAGVCGRGQFLCGHRCDEHSKCRCGQKAAERVAFHVNPQEELGKVR